MRKVLRASFHRPFHRPPLPHSDSTADSRPQTASVGALDVTSLSGDTSYLRRVVALSDGAHVLAGGDNNQLFLYSAAGERVYKLPHPPGHRGHYDDFVRGLADLGNGLFVTSNICCGRGSLLRIWRLSAQAIPEVICTELVADRVYALCRVDESTFVAGVAGTLVFYSHDNGAAVRQLPRLRASWIHSDVIYEIAAHGTRVVTASNDRTAMVWNWEACAPVTVLRTGHAVICTAMDATTVVLGSRSAIYVYDATTSAFGRKWFLANAHDNSVMGCRLFGRYVLSVSLDGTALVTDATTGVFVSRSALKLPIYGVDAIPAPPVAGGGSWTETPPQLVCVGLGDALIFTNPLLGLRGKQR
jgi:WD40 repeat protein